MTDDTNRLPDEVPELPDNREISKNVSEEHPRRKRIKVKKRIKQRVRVKKKPSIKKRLKKIMGYLAWFIIIGSFLITIFVLVRELDIKDEDAKKKAPKKKQSYLLPNKIHQALLGNVNKHIKVIHFNQTENITALNSLT